LAAEALDIWESLPVHYPFQWMALWPLAAVAVAHQRTSEALNHVRAMLAVGQQLAPPPLRALMAVALQRYELGNPVEAVSRLQRAVGLAEHDGFL
jgi:eukaryotic-like serine/threonine-protein kinase